MVPAQQGSPRVAVVTGASSGIGRATAHAFARDGWSVVVAARDEQSLKEAARECEEAGGQALALPTDIREAEAVQALVDRTIERFGRIDVWVSNAAVMAYGAFEETPPEVHRTVVETNLLGTMSCARAVLPHFRRQGHGVLIQVGSLYGKMTSPFVGAYVTSKFGLIGFSEVLRQELSDAPDIHVSLILPSSVDTPVFRHSANYTGSRVRPVPPVSDPKRVVRAIRRCADRPRRVIVVGQTGRLLSWGHALFPVLYDRLVPWVMRRVGLRSGEVEDGPGNVFEPMPEWNRLGGEWRRVPAPVSLTALAAASGAWLLWRWRRRSY